MPRRFVWTTSNQFTAGLSRHTTPVAACQEAGPQAGRPAVCPKREAQLRPPEGLRGGHSSTIRGPFADADEFVTRAGS